MIPVEGHPILKKENKVSHPYRQVKDAARKEDAVGMSHCAEQGREL